MERTKAQELVEAVMAAWSWEMGQATQEVWIAALSELVNAEAAELGVLALYKSRSFRPAIADVVEAYHAQLRQQPEPEPAAVPTLPTPAGLPAVVDLAWSPEGARWAAGDRKGLRIEDVVRCEQQAQEAYRSLGETPQERKNAVMASMHSLVDRVGTNVGKDSDFGRLCTKHDRWVGTGQTKDPCFTHVFGELVPEGVDPDLHIPLPPCPRCNGEDVGECGHLAEVWKDEVDGRTKALLKKRGEARDDRRALL